MEENLILEGLLSMVTELKEKLEAQVTYSPYGRNGIWATFTMRI